MRAIVLLFAFSLLSSYDAEDSDIVTPVFVQTGKDLLLDVMAPVHRFDRDLFQWRYNEKENIIRLFSDNTTIIPDPYQGRVEFFRQNYSLLLKNVTQADSGDYRAGVQGNKDVSVGKYKVTVQDPVSPVHGNVSVSRSSDSCNLTVTCSTKDSHHISSTFRCDNKTCSQDEGGDRSKVTTSGASLRVYLSNGSSVICNHSNQVSSAEDIIKIECDSFSDCVTKPPSPVVIAVIITVTVVVSVVVVIVAIAKVVQHRKKRKIAEQSMDMKNTVYESVQVNTMSQHLDQTPPDEASAPSQPSIYSLVESQHMTLPESHYAQEHLEQLRPRYNCEYISYLIVKDT
ncbi:SLAM family member 5-like isoform X1 [Paralichthys olivaceus]|uniref:SLAM family member 5-like isoform X1 n=1 Tax=Paralichthys olivaceus TaxID=8255 RepID=UPI0037500A08